MTDKEIKEIIKNLDGSIKKIEKGKSKLLFFVADSKGTPIGSLSYIYDIAYKMKEMGYNVQMLYAEKEFVGVEQWLGKKYSDLPHANISKDIVDISPSDVVFIPELYSSVMTKTKELKCKKVAILQNFDYMTDLIPFGASWMSMGIFDCITTSNRLKERLNEVFPQINTRVIRPVIDEQFKPSDDQQLIVNIVTKNEKEINGIVKPFKWRYPMFGFVTFRYINGKSREDFAKYISEGTITIWLDEKTDFGYSALEAMACGNIVIGKVPENEPEWMIDENGKMKDNGIWFYKMRDLPQLLCDVILSVLYERVPEEIYDNMKQTLNEYTDIKQLDDLKNVIINDIIESKKEELIKIRDSYKNKLEKK